MKWPGHIGIFHPPQFRPNWSSWLFFWPRAALVPVLRFCASFCAFFSGHGTFSLEILICNFLTLSGTFYRCKLSVSTTDFHRCGFNRTMGPSTRRSAKSLSSVIPWITNRSLNMATFCKPHHSQPHKKWIGFHDSCKIRWFCIKLVQHILVNNVFTTRIIKKFTVSPFQPPNGFSLPSGEAWTWDSTCARGQGARLGVGSVSAGRPNANWSPGADVLTPDILRHFEPDSIWIWPGYDLDMRWLWDGC